MSKLQEALDLLEHNNRHNSYKPLPFDLSKAIRDYYTECLPDWVKRKEINRPLIMPNRSYLSNKWKRVVVGDYGAFIEIYDNDICHKNIKPKWPGTPNRPVKYLWYIPRIGPEIKIYWQKGTVNYADYKPDFWYVSPYDVNCFVNYENKK